MSLTFTPMSKWTKIENSSDFDEKRYSIVILHANYVKNKKISPGKLTFLGGP
jgi:hypothetical protein